MSSSAEENASNDDRHAIDHFSNVLEYLSDWFHERSDHLTKADFSNWPDSSLEGLRAMSIVIGSTNIKELRLERNGLGCVVNWENAAGLFNRMHQLEKLGLNANHIGINCCTALIKILQNERSKLRVLCLGSNDIDEECVAILVEALKSNNSLSSLMLGRNNIRAGGCVALSPLLHHDASKLKVLDLSGNSIDEEGLGVLADVLSNNGILQELHLAYNAIGVDGCRAIEPLLRSRKSRIKNLGLGANNIDNECSSVLADGLKHNATLQILDLDENGGITPAGWKHFLKLVCDGTSIESTYNTNHTLLSLGHKFEWENKNAGRVYIHDGNFTYPTSCFCTKDDDVADRIIEVLEDFNGFNKTRSAHAVGRHKVAVVHFNNIMNFNVEEILDLNVKLMPRLIAWMRNSSGMKGLYRVIRNWNVPAMFEFPSRAELKIRKLETENNRLKLEIDTLKQKNAALERENKSLRSM